MAKKVGIRWEEGRRRGLRRRGGGVPDKGEMIRTGFCRVFFFWTGEIFVAGLGITSAIERSFICGCGGPTGDGDGLMQSGMLQFDPRG